MGGSLPGERRGGRQKGSKNKRTVERDREIAVTGETPLQYMLRVMRDPEGDPVRRDTMARAAAVYCHPRLESITHKGEAGSPIELLLREIDGSTRGPPMPKTEKP